jgi:hypothetical protein
MIWRVNLAGAAMAALALIVWDVAAAHAAKVLCNAQPERCRYASNGRQYFYPSGRPMPTGVEGPAGAGTWGCAATDGTAKGRTWGFRNQAAASHLALSICERRSTSQTCRIVSCSSKVATSGDAYAIFFVSR